MTRVLIFIAALMLCGCGRSVLPPERDLLVLSQGEIKALVFAHTAIGSSRGEVEQALRRSFRKDWRVIDYDSTTLIAKRGFSVPVAGGDYYFISDFASAMRAAFATDVASVYFLFDREDKLKDVAVKKWTDSI
jgi:hypothetical protein